jgi:F0F1-type ATP synthase assembly protein I
MEFFVKIAISVAIIIVCTQIGRNFPSLSGLIATMPIVSVIILVWIYSDNPGNFKLMEDFTRAALWGIIPSILFFVAAYVSFVKHYPIGIVLCVSFGTWLVGAFVHQWLLRG